MAHSLAVDVDGGLIEAMIELICYFVLVVACFFALVVAVFLAEVLAAVCQPQRASEYSRTAQPRSIAVLVPAHNESTGLVATLADIKAQLRSQDRLIAIADNCDDDTAAVAATAGAEVIERHNSAKRGKGYALDWGLQHLRNDPPEIVVAIDADCRLAEGTIERLARTCLATRRPAQALDLMVAPEGSPLQLRVAEFAWRVKNWVRPLGLRALGLPCQLMGTGMAFEWELIRTCDVAGGSLVEDLELGFDLARAGSPAVFCPSAQVTSRFPISIRGVESQRFRWEKGHIGMILAVAPRLFFLAIVNLNWDLLALVLDISVPPLSLLGMLLVGISVIGVLTASLGASYAASFVSITSLLAFLCGILLCWLKYGRDILPGAALLSTPWYGLRKLSLYRRIFAGKTGSQWIRTDRGNGNSHDA